MFDFDMRAGAAPTQPEETVPIVGPGQLSRYRGLRFDDMNAQQLRTAYKSIAAALIDYRAQAFAPHLADLAVMRRESQQEAEEVEPDHPWVELLRKPSPHTPATIFFEVCSKIVDGQGHVDLMVQYRSEAGRDVPDALRVIYPEYADVDPVYDEMGDVRAWEIQRRGGGNEMLHPKSVIRLKRPHPSAAWRTAGKLEAAAYEVDELQAQNVYGRDTARNQGKPNVVLNAGEGVESKQKARKIAKDMSRMYNERTGLTPVEYGDMEFKDMTLTPSDLDFLESRRFTTDQLLTIFEIPKGMLSAEQSATGQGRDGARAQFDEYTVQPYVNKRAEQLSHELRRVFDAEGSGLFLEPPDVVQMSPKQKLEIDRKRLETGTPANRVLRERGEEEVEGGDTPLVARGLQSLQKATGPSLG
jgi:HK97 family phage portal protein